VRGVGALWDCFPVFLVSVVVGAADVGLLLGAVPPGVGRCLSGESYIIISLWRSQL